MRTNPRSFQAGGAVAGPKARAAFRQAHDMRVSALNKAQSYDDKGASSDYERAETAKDRAYQHLATGAKGGGRLTAKQRQAMPKSSFALPGRGEGPKGAGAGSYPIPDESHAKNALARVSQHGSPAEKSAVRAKVHAKFPNIGKT